MTYRIDNKEEVDVGIFNRIPMLFPDGTIEFSPDTSYVSIEGDCVQIQKMALPLPKGLNASGYRPPNVTRVGAGKQFEETINLHVPVRVCHPFQRAMVGGQVIADKLESANRVRVLIGVFLCDSECKLVSENPAFPDVLSAASPGLAITRQIILLAEFDAAALQPPEPIQVLNYRGVEW